jgi:predicted outer membrane repeat protein
VAIGTYNNGTTTVVPNTVLISGGWIGNFTAQNDPDTTVLNMGGAGTAFTIQPGSSNQPRISNLTIDNAAAPVNGGAIFVQNFARPQFNDLIVKNSQAAQGGAIYIGTNADVKINRSVFMSNTASSDGGALYVRNNATVSIQQSQFFNNVIDSSTLLAGVEGGSNSGGAVFVEGGLVLAQNDLFAASTAENNGGAWERLVMKGTMISSPRSTRPPSWPFVAPLPAAASA